jgi:putative CocE/NonD family hydrolase
MSVQRGVGAAVDAVERVAIRMRDGVQLSAQVTIPPGAGRSPVLLFRDPYGAVDGEWIVRKFVHPAGTDGLARNGWAVVHQDVRGRFESDGVYRPFLDDVHDAYDTIEWCASQEWSNGRIVMSCPSGLGATQHLAAASNHPALVAVTPQLGAADIRRFWVHDGDARQWAFILGWAAQQTVNDRGVAESTRVWAAEVANNPARFAAAPASNHRLREASTFFDAWIRDDDAWWAPLERSLTGDPPRAAGFHIAGWYDLFVEGSIDAYAWMIKGGNAQLLVVGPWSHTTLLDRHVGEVDFGEAADGYRGNVIERMRTFLSDAVEGRRLDRGAEVFIMGENRWRHFDQWPPSSNAVRWYLGAVRPANTADGGGTLSLALSNDGVDSFRYEPADPVPTCGGRCLYLPDGPRDQHHVEERGDVLVYTSESLDEDMTIAGMVTADLTVSASTRHADVAAKLVIVGTSGAAYNIVDSVRRLTFDRDVPALTRVSLGSCAVTVRRGERLRLEVAGSNFPRCDPSPVAATQSVYWGRNWPSFLRIPVIT